MSLVDKLRRIAAPAQARDAPASLPGGADLPGERIAGPGGEIWMRARRFPLDHVHGRLRLGEIPAQPAARLAEVAREHRLLERELGRAVFFDTETTSLGGGVGTLVFLVGAGWFDGDAFVVEQYFLSRVTEEPALLRAIGERFREFDFAVSFHGKGFDAPRLLGRLAFHRMEFALPEVHLDLCQVGRSLYRGAYADCRLQTFERHLVGFRRAADLPGAECPRAYFDYLQGNGVLIPRVFEHNLNDVLTLPAVAACFARELGAPRDPVVLANLGSYYESVGRDPDARDAYATALEGLRQERHPLRARTLERLALLERRSGRHAESAALLLERKEFAPHSFQPLEDLAKYYEHRARDLTRAEEAALEARSRLLDGKIRVDNPTRRRYLRALGHRLNRLRRRLDRASQG